jgi:hypothetical protein
VKEILIGIIVAVVSGLILYYLIDLRPKRKQKKEKERQATWKNDRSILSGLTQFLGAFNSLGRRPEFSEPQLYMGLANQIKNEAHKITRPEFQEIKNKLIQYGNKANQVNQNMNHEQLKEIFLKTLSYNNQPIYEPLKLKEEIEEVLRKTRKPPY